MDNLQTLQTGIGVVGAHDQLISQEIDALVKKMGHTPTEMMNAFPLYVRRQNLTKFLAHVELFKMVADLPGSIVECGVFRGASLLTWAKCLEIFNTGDRIRKVFGFDSFEGFSSLNEKDGTLDNTQDKKVGGWNPSAYYEELLKHIDMFHADSFLPRAKRIELVLGDLTKTAPKFALENPGFRISLLHLDVDLYEPTLAALKAFYPLLVEGGVVVLDEYAVTHWAGESKAVEEYFEGKMPRIQKLPYNSTPGGYFVKKSMAVI